MDGSRKRSEWERTKLSLLLHAHVKFIFPHILTNRKFSACLIQHTVRSGFLSRREMKTDESSDGGWKFSHISFELLLTSSVLSALNSNMQMKLNLVEGDRRGSWKSPSNLWWVAFKLLLAKGNFKHVRCSSVLRLRVFPTQKKTSNFCSFRLSIEMLINNKMISQPRKWYLKIIEWPKCVAQSSARFHLFHSGSCLRVNAKKLAKFNLIRFLECWIGKLHLFTNKSRLRKAQSINHSMFRSILCGAIKTHSELSGEKREGEDRKGTRNSIMSSSCFVGFSFFCRVFNKLTTALSISTFSMRPKCNLNFLHHDLIRGYLQSDLNK